MAKPVTSTKGGASPYSRGGGDSGSSSKDTATDRGPDYLHWRNPEGSTGMTVQGQGSYQGSSPKAAVESTHFSDDPEEQKRRR